MQEITSSRNDNYKTLKQLATSAKARRRSGRTLIEGVHLCQAYLQHFGQPQMCVVGRSAMLNAEVKSLIAAMDSATDVVLLDDSQFKALSALDNAIAILFVAVLPSAKLAAELTDRDLLLEDVQDPGNFGTILRTAAAAGVTTVYASAGCATAWSPKALRAGMGAQFVLTIHENAGLAQLITASSVQVLATSLKATTSIYEQDMAQPTAWLFGNEGQGVSEDLLALDVQKVIIPQNQDVESLNVAAAAAVCLFEHARQRHSG